MQRRVRPDVTNCPACFGKRMRMRLFMGISYASGHPTRTGEAPTICPCHVCHGRGLVLLPGKRIGARRLPVLT